jgi:hypothetical protein
MSNEYNAPWRFDGHGINDRIGTRIAKVSFQPYENGNERNPLFDKYSNLIKEAPIMLDTLERILPALETAAHLMRLNGSEEEYELFKQDAELVRETILGTRRY